MGKPKIALPQPSVYRDTPVVDDAASTSSAVLLDDIDGYPDEELPAYTDDPMPSASHERPGSLPLLLPSRHV